MEITTTGSDALSVTLVTESCYTLGSNDNAHAYDHEYSRGPEAPFSSLGVTCEDHSCALMAPGGPTALRKSSAVATGGKVFVACGDSVFGLTLPELDLLWSVKVDFASCFGVFHCPELGCLVSHGECDIARISFGGEVLWSTSGPDIFSGEFSLCGTSIKVTDFYENNFVIDVQEGTLRRED